MSTVTPARRHGVLLINLGTPDSAETPAVRRYLRQFLMDGRVIDIPVVWRWLLVNLIIAPFRSPKSAHAYGTVWTEKGSPLLLHSRSLCDAVAQQLGDGYAVELGMRYGNPSIPAALEALRAAEVDKISVLPLFPHYASATTGSAMQAVYDVVRKLPHIPPLDLKAPFYDDEGFIEAVVAAAGNFLADFAPDFCLFSYHGLPVRQVEPMHVGSAPCANDSPCEALGPNNRDCYRGQCFATTRLLAARLGLSESSYATSFQSRLGKTPWLQPYTVEMLPRLRQQGKKRLAVFSPAFVSDCLETLEELGIQGRKMWMDLGGEDFLLVPCVNDHPAFVRMVARIVGA